MEEGWAVKINTATSGNFPRTLPQVGLGRAAQIIPYATLAVTQIASPYIHPQGLPSTLGHTTLCASSSLGPNSVRALYINPSWIAVAGSWRAFL